MRLRECANMNVLLSVYNERLLRNQLRQDEEETVVSNLLARSLTLENE